jgi:hypothetical protein
MAPGDAGADWISARGANGAFFGSITAIWARLMMFNFYGKTRKIQCFIRGSFRSFRRFLPFLPFRFRLPNLRLRRLPPFHR